jgi:hypothetical protein
MSAAPSFHPPAIAPAAPRLTRRRLVPATGRLLPSERAELEYLWNGYESDLGARSVHGAIEDRLRRSSPKALAGPIVDLLRVAGGRTPLKLLVRALRTEQQATRYEVTGALGGLVAAKRVAVEGGGSRAVDWIHHDGPGDLDHVVVRLLPTVANEKTTREARWREQDAELEREWRQMVCADDAAHVTETTVSASTSKAESALRWLSAVGQVHARVLYLVHGPKTPNARYDIWGDTAPLAPLTTTVAKVRSVLVATALEAFGVHKRRWIEADITFAKVVHDGLVGAGGNTFERARRSNFVRAVKEDADTMLVSASAAYRAARSGP